LSRAQGPGALCIGAAALALVVAVTACAPAPGRPGVEATEPAPTVAARPVGRAPDPAVQPPFPVRAAFYYPWFPEGWRQRSMTPYARHLPTLGLYDSGDPGTIASHVRSMAYGGIRAAIVSWWGKGQKSEQDRVPVLFGEAAAVDPDFRIALYYEREGSADPSVEELVGDLTYVRDRYAVAGNHLRVGDRPVMFVYSADDLDCTVVDRWTAATAAVDFYAVLKVFPGWERCTRPPDGWHQYAPAEPYVSVVPEDPAVAGSVSISPGFWRADESRPLLPRDPGRWRRDVAAMTRSDVPWHLVTTFDEWGEGTAVQSADEWRTVSGEGTYLDVLHNGR
jgi:Glycosyl hydrolase family 99